MYTTSDKTNKGSRRFRWLGQIIVTGIIAMIVVRWLFPGTDPVRVLEKVAKITPPVTTKSYLELGTESLKSPDGARAARAYFSKALDTDPQNPMIYYNRSLASLALERPNEALIDLERTIELDPTFTLAYYSFGLIYKQQGDLEKAHSNFDRAISLQPDLTDALLFRAGIYRDAQRFDDAIKDYSQAIDTLPESAPPWMVYNLRMDRAWVYMTNNMVDQGISDYLVAYETIPQNAKLIRMVLNQFQTQVDGIDPDSQTFLKFSELMEKLEQS